MNEQYGSVAQLGALIFPSYPLGCLLAKAAAEEFIGGDPFVVSGVVRNPSIRGWNEVLS
jgi:hypothetical protein